MREYIQSLDHCPFCKEKLEGPTLLKKYYRSVCPNHNFENKNISVWCFKKDINKPNHVLYVRVHVQSSFKNYVNVVFDVLKNKDRTKIFDYREDGKVIYGPTIDLKFDKFLNFDLSDEGNFKRKLNAILLFS